MDKTKNNNTINKIQDQDRPAHEWFRFVLSYPPHLVKEYLQKFDLSDKCLVLDPFCGTGTTLVECKKNGIPSIGFETNPFPHFASNVKVRWSINSNDLMAHAREVADHANELLAIDGIEDSVILDLPQTLGKYHANTLRTLSAEQEKIILKNSISPLPLHKTLVLLSAIEEKRAQEFYDIERLAVAKILVFTVSNLHFGPEVGVRKPKGDASVIGSWLNCITQMAGDLAVLNPFNETRAEALPVDAREINGVLPNQSIDAIITSPPYPNEKDYTRTTRLESVILGFIKNKLELRSFKQKLIRSNTRGVYKIDEDDNFIKEFERIGEIADKIEERRIELGKTSGFERLYARVTRLYFGGMYRHLKDLRQLLKPGARLAYVVGDQESYLRVNIPTGELLAEIAEKLNYVVEDIELFRTRHATATRKKLREEVLLLKKPK